MPRRKRDKKSIYTRPYVSGFTCVCFRDIRLEPGLKDYVFRGELEKLPLGMAAGQTKLDEEVLQKFGEAHTHSSSNSSKRKESRC